MTNDHNSSSTSSLTSSSTKRSLSSAGTSSSTTSSPRQVVPICMAPSLGPFTSRTWCSTSTSGSFWLWQPCRSSCFKSFFRPLDMDSSLDFEPLSSKSRLESMSRGRKKLLKQEERQGCHSQNEPDVEDNGSKSRLESMSRGTSNRCLRCPILHVACHLHRSATQGGALHVPSLPLPSPQCVHSRAYLARSGWT